MIITTRQDVVVTDDGRRVFFCDKSCRTAEIVKWSIFLGLTLLLILYLTIGYWHAMRRVRRGQQPLRYHKWLAPKRFRHQNDPAYYNPQYGTYGMQPYPEPPPVYNANGMPPMYTPPPGGSKVAPQQNGVMPNYPPPQGTPLRGTPQLPPPAL